MHEPRLNPPQTPVDAPSGPSLDGNPDSDLQTRAANPDSDGLTLEIDTPCTLTIKPRSDAKKNIQTRAEFVSYDDYARLEGIDKRTIYYRASRGLIRRLTTGDLGRNGKPVYAIPLSELSASARALYWREKGGQFIDSTGRGTGTRASHGQAPQTPNGDGGRQATSIEHVERAGEAEAGQSHSQTCASPAQLELDAAMAGPVDSPTGNPRPAATPPRATADRRCATPPAARFNGDEIPVLASDPARVWEAGLTATHSKHAVETFFLRRRAVTLLEAEQAACAHGEALHAARRVADRLGLDSYRTLLTWQRRYRRHGEPGLVPKWKKTGGSKTIPKRLQAQIEAFYAQGGGHDELDRPTIYQCWAFARDWAIEAYRTAGGKPHVPSYYAVSRFIASLHKARPMLVETARRGPKHFGDHFEFHCRRDPQAMPLGDCFVLDHRVMDTHVIAPSGKIVRPWLTAIADIHSADFAGWVLREQVSSDGVASAFRRAILGFAVLHAATGEWIEFPPHGAPKHAYLDHGKEFHGGPMKDRVQARGGRFSKEFSHSPKDMALDQAVSETLFSGLGIHRVTAIRYSARSKPIEPIFGSFATRVENLIAGHCGRNALDKPEQLLERKKRGELLSWTQYLGVLASAIQTWRTERPIGRDRDLPPAAYWENWQGELPDPARLDTLLLRKDAKKIRGCGIEIQHGKTTYHYLIDDPEFAILSGSYVMTYWSQDDVEACIVVHPVSGRRLVLPRVDLRGESWQMMLGGEMPEVHRDIKRAAGKQKQLVAGYRRWAAEQRPAALADPTGSLRLADANGAEIRGHVRDIRREAQAARPPATPPPPPTSAATYYGRLGRTHLDLDALLAAPSELEPDDER